MRTFPNIAELSVLETSSQTMNLFVRREDAMEHDLLLTRKDGSVRCLRIYDRPIPKDGEVITLPVDGRLIKASIKGAPEEPETTVLADVEAVEI
jgi:hypothetical protein